MEYKKLKFDPAEVNEEEAQQLLEAVEQLSGLMAGTSDICLHCGQQVTSMHQSGRSVYGSCGCRLWQGRVPEAWKDRMTK